MDQETYQRTLKQALQHQQDGHLEQAQRLFETILAQLPQDADALHGMGLLCAQKRDFRQALIWLKKAVEQAPTVPGFHNNLGNAYKALNQANEAIKHYHQALRLKTPYPEARNNLGRLLFQQGLLAEAQTQLQKAVREDPEHVDAHFNLGNCYTQQERLTDAISHYQQVLKLRPDHLGAIHNLGIALTALKDFERAKPYLEQVIQREPNNLDALFHLGIIQASLGHLDEAITLYQKTIEIDPNHADAHHNLATVLLHQKKTDEALDHYKQALALNPHNRTAAHMIQALSGEETEQGAPTEYIRALFDQYAYSYDTQVTQQLEYQVPAKLRQALTPWISKTQHLWHILDLGCGTGLCAPYFRDVAEKLTGVDLSPNMIEVAQQQGGYDRLIVSDIHQFLNKDKHRYDLILAADVFVYFGELDHTFAEVSKHLKPGGFFAFSVEKKVENGKGYELRSTGRYAHHIQYLTQLTTHHSFDMITHEETTLRKQDDEPMIGYICVLQKKPNDS